MPLFRNVKNKNPKYDLETYANSNAVKWFVGPVWGVFIVQYIEQYLCV